MALPNDDECGFFAEHGYWIPPVMLTGQSDFLGTDLEGQLDRLAAHHDVEPQLLEMEAWSMVFPRVATAG